MNAENTLIMIYEDVADIFDTGTVWCSKHERYRWHFGHLPYFLFLIAADAKFFCQICVFSFTFFVD